MSSRSIWCYTRRRPIPTPHTSVVVGDDAILHLCAELNHPAVWTERDFAQREYYRCRIGARRLAQ